MKKLTCLLLAVLGMVSESSAATLEQLNATVRKILADNDKSHYRGVVLANDYQAGGFAAVRGFGNNYNIFVNRQRMAQESLNTWAFVLGHELAHVILRHGGQNGPSHEQAADVLGARMAINAGFKVKDFIRKIYRDPNSCSVSHGCFHSRARNLETTLKVDTGLWNQHHQGHRPMHAHFPPLRQLPVVPPIFTARPAPVRQPCVHVIPCRHPVYNGFQWVPLHRFDQLHAFDVSY